MNVKIILVLLGKRGAGKTSLAKMFVNKNDFLHVEMSKYLNELKANTLFKEMILRDYVELTHRKKGKDYFIKHLYFRHLATSNRNFVITGIRHLAEVNFLNKHLVNCKLIFVYLNVSFVKRLLRVAKREDRNSLNQFLIEEYYSEKWGNRKLKRITSKFNYKGGLDGTFSELNRILSLRH